uniref:Putative MAT1-1-10 protein n=1 Tax=Teratosphaeria gauchensis TaxID=405846 RepID=A0A5C0PX51_9PEZI|nr:putative MAT1-1-10 protein [Teratosphaeria gauchensis]
MDLLSDNFPLLRPGIQAPTATETQDEKSIESSGNASSPTSLLERLSELEIATIRDDDDVVSAEDIAVSLSENLQQLADLLQHPEKFENEETRKAFFRRAGRILRGIGNANKMWQGTRSAVREFEEDDDERKLSDISLVRSSSKAAPWSAWCRSVRPVADKEVVGLARSDDSLVLASEQHLPRGGLGIMGQWQLGVRRVVNGILDDVQDEARRAIINSQQASFQNTVYTNTPELGVYQPRETTQCWTFAEPHEQLMPSHASVVHENIASLATIASRLRKSVVNTGGDYREMGMQRWFSAPGLWAQRANVVWDPRAL